MDFLIFIELFIYHKSTRKNIENSLYKQRNNASTKTKGIQKRILYELFDFISLCSIVGGETHSYKKKNSFILNTTQFFRLPSYYTLRRMCVIVAVVVGSFVLRSALLFASLFFYCLFQLCDAFCLTEMQESFIKWFTVTMDKVIHPKTQRRCELNRFIGLTVRYIYTNVRAFHTHKQ